jgi:hypothetical protein
MFGMVISDQVDAKLIQRVGFAGSPVRRGCIPEAAAVASLAEPAGKHARVRGLLEVAVGASPLTFRLPACPPG